MNIIFTDIDGVLNTKSGSQWNKKSIDFYNLLCREFDLKPVITSTWRSNHTKKQLQEIFTHQGVLTPIYDFVPILQGEGRGIEIEQWLFNNHFNKFVILDDHTHDIEVIGLPNIIKCRSWIGFSKEEYDLARRILLK